MYSQLPSQCFARCYCRGDVRCRTGAETDFVKFRFNNIQRYAGSGGSACGATNKEGGTGGATDAFSGYSDSIKDDPIKDELSLIQN